MQHPRVVGRWLVCLSIPILAGASACLPYTVGSTAQTVPVGQTSTSTSWYFIPNALKAPGDSIAAPLAGVDKEWRHGIDERSDLGVRVTSGAGAVINYKHRFVDYGQGGAPALAYMVGSGVVNGGQHLHFESTLLASGDERAAVMPYGGLRIMQVLPISAGAAHDSPTIGVLGGLQLGDASFIVRPELGVFYDRSALGVRSANYIIVPAVTLQRRSRAESQLATPGMAGKHDATGERSKGDVLRCLIGFCRTQTTGTSLR